MKLFKGNKKVDPKLNDWSGVLGDVQKAQSQLNEKKEAKQAKVDKLNDWSGVAKNIRNEQQQRREQENKELMNKVGAKVSEDLNGGKNEGGSRNFEGVRFTKASDVKSLAHAKSANLGTVEFSVEGFDYSREFNTGVGPCRHYFFTATDGKRYRWFTTSKHFDQVPRFVQAKVVNVVEKEVDGVKYYVNEVKGCKFAY